MQCTRTKQCVFCLLTVVILNLQFYSSIPLFLARLNIYKGGLSDVTSHLLTSSSRKFVLPLTTITQYDPTERLNTSPYFFRRSRILCKKFTVARQLYSVKINKSVFVLSQSSWSFLHNALLPTPSNYRHQSGQLA
jgi:hypothetical protein